MLAEIEIVYSAETVIKALDDETYHEVREKLPFLDLPLEREPWKWNVWNVGRQVIDLRTTGAALLEHGLRYEIKRFKGCRVVEQDAPTAVNIQIAIPNLQLFSIREVCLLEDSCTNELQDRLDAGWYILAVCPPANQRRPDYILGRSPPNV